MGASSVAVPRARSLRSPRLLRAASDERLVALVRDGDAHAFEAVYERHHRGLLSFCRHMLSNREEGEDAVQQTFLAAHRSLVGSTKEIQLKPWLYSIARNRCLSMLRARREQATGEELEVATEGLADEVQRRSDLRELLVDLRALPEHQREALVLGEIGSLGHDEIAEVIGVPKVKVKALVFQARESLLASKTARETPCFEIREQLSTLRGGALRRGNLRRHLRECQGCREYRAHVERQRAALALVIPVIPTLALKHASMPAAVAAKLGGGGGATGGGLALAGAKGVAVKVVAAIVLAGVGTAGTVAVVDSYAGRGHDKQALPVSSRSLVPAAARRTVHGQPSARTPAGAASARAHRHAGAARGSRPGPHPSSARRHVSGPRRATSSRRTSARGAAPLRVNARPAPGRQGAAGGNLASGGGHGRSGHAPGRHRGNSGVAHAQHGGGGEHGRSGTAPGIVKQRPGRSGFAPGHLRR